MERLLGKLQRSQERKLTYEEIDDMVRELVTDGMSILIMRILWG